MKKRTAMSLILAIAMVLCFAGMTLAVEKKIDVPIESVTVALDKNGNEYTRLIVTVPRTVDGVEYSLGMACMAFGSLNIQAKEMKAGDILSAIVSERVWQGRTSLTLIKIL